MILSVSSIFSYVKTTPSDFLSFILAFIIVMMVTIVIVTTLFIISSFLKYLYNFIANKGAYLYDVNNNIKHIDREQQETIDIPHPECSGINIKEQIF